MPPIDPFAVAAALLVAGVIASFVPLIPGGLLSLGGIGYYWWATGEPGTIAIVGLVVLGALTVLFDWLGSALAARIGGADLRTTAVAAIAAVVLFSVLGPLGAVVGIAGAVFALEYRRHGDAGRSARTAAYATVGTLASTAAQILLTLSILVAFVLAVLL